jgi:hypothetical protein
MLKILRNAVNDSDTKNLDAILAAYRSGSLRIERGQVSYWKNGTLKRGLGEPIPSASLPDYLDKWTSEEGGRTWIERVSCSLIFLSL